MARELLTHTKRRDFKNCKRYYLHRHVNHLQLRAQKTGRRRGTAFGNAIHACRTYLTETLAHEGPNYMPHRDEWLEREIIRSVAESYSAVVISNQEDEDTVELEMLKIICMAQKYIERYGIDKRREVEFDLPLINPTTKRHSMRFRRAGKIDGVIVISHNRARVIEDKFVGQIQQVMIERLPLDDQIHEYTDAFNQLGWEAEIEYRHTRYPGINPRKAKIKQLKSGPKEDPGEPLDEFADRLSEDVESRPEFYFDRQGPLILPTDVHEEYRHERWGVAQDIIAAGKKVGTPLESEVFYKNPSRCWEYGGCEFIPLCTMVPGAGDRYVIVPDNQELDASVDTSEGATTEYGPETR